MLYKKYAEIVFNLPVEGAFTYEITGNDIAPGTRIEAEFKNRTLPGIVIETHNLEPNYKTKSIKKILDKTPLLTQDQIKIAEWMQEYYLSTLGESLFKMLPRGKRFKEKIPDPDYYPEKIKKLNPEQESVYQNISQDMNISSCHLLHGITGSGKTEIYIKLIQDTFEKKQGAILLVPEISLTIQMISRLQEVFGDNIALLHSGLKTSERFQSYMDILTGKKNIAVGTRSAIFAPVNNLKLIIMDEEHDGSYKDNSSPRYHARQIAFYRSMVHNALLVLGSATPSVEVYFQAKSGKIRLNELTKRANNLPLPEISIKKSHSYEIIGNDLVFEIKKRLDKKEQVILLLNRRGHSPLIYLKDKKTFAECPNCTSNLCYHATDSVICHLCGYKSNLNTIRKIYNSEIELQGKGTQKLEEYLLETFKQARVERLDQDSSRNREVLTEVVNRLIHGEIDILTGTQMISKGLDASNVTLVGVINANIGLGLPDFRAEERVFSNLTQVAGRAGRAQSPGKVIIETSDPDNEIIKMAVTQNYKIFYEYEIRNRKDLFYPPFSRIIRFISRSPKEESSQKTIQNLRTEIDKSLQDNPLENTYILGPAPCPFYKIDSNYRNHIIIKTMNIQALKKNLKSLLAGFAAEKNTYLEIDIDPVELL